VVSPAAGLADAVQQLARYALAFGRIDRTSCLHPDGSGPESDADHTVMLGWIAPAVAARFFPDLPPGDVAAFALVHDAVEVHAGDTCTLRIDAAGQAAKTAREAAAADRWRAEFAGTLPWLPQMITRYESQREPAARFTRALDKILPKLVHLENRCADLIPFGITAAELEVLFTRQRADIAAYAGEFGALMDLYDETTVRVLDMMRAAGAAPVVG
jgi:5'-deoxynucleotidase YfbR-like HD superfamily hydrolase